MYPVPDIMIIYPKDPGYTQIRDSPAGMPMLTKVHGRPATVNTERRTSATSFRSSGSFRNQSKIPLNLVCKKDTVTLGHAGIQIKSQD